MPYSKHNYKFINLLQLDCFMWKCIIPTILLEEGINTLNFPPCTDKGQCPFSKCETAQFYFAIRIDRLHKRIERKARDVFSERSLEFGKLGATLQTRFSLSTTMSRDLDIKDKAICLLEQFIPVSCNLFPLLQRMDQFSN